MRHYYYSQAGTTGNRYTVHQQSTQCPDGYARTIWFIWDNDANQIVYTSCNAVEINVEMTYLRFGPRAML